MGQDKDIQLLPGGMDKDSDERTIADGDFIDALNMRMAISGSNNQGAGENVRGNLNVSNPFLTPASVNKAVGYLEDNKDNSGIYCVYNSLGYHGIYRYFRSKGNTGTGVIEKLLQIKNPSAYTLVNNPLNFDPDHYITGVDLIGDKFYWTDNLNRPRKINVIKANDTDKKKIFRIYFNQDGFEIGAAYTFTLLDAFATPIVTLTYNTPATPTPSVDSALEDFMNAFTSSVTALGVMSASGCQGYVELEMNTPGDFFGTLSVVTTLGTFSSLVVPYNFYPDNIPGVGFIDFPADLIDAVKYPPMCQPTVAYKTDPKRDVNLVREKVFQFRAQYVYDDDEKSVWGAISAIAVPTQTCDNSQAGVSENYIEVDFTDARLNDITLMSIIKRVNIAVREHNTGDWKLIDQLDPYQWGIGNNIYKFYNDKVYQVIDVAEAILPYHAFPDLAKSQTLIDDRLFYAGLTEGHDKVCIDAKIDIEYTPNIKPQTFTIRGVVFIRGLYTPLGASPNNSNIFSALYQPIHARSNAGTIFGGADGVGFLDFWESENTVLNSASQVLPLNGFTMYLAGTPFYGVSRQYQLSGNGTLPAPTQYSSGYFGSATLADRQKVVAAMFDPTYSGGTPFLFSPWSLGAFPQPHANNQFNNPYIGNTPTEPYTSVFSTFEINGVPEGKYVLRVADHRTTQAQLNGASLSWQRQSTNVIEVGGAFDTEIVVDVSATTAVGGYVYVGRTCIADLSGLKVAQGYIADHDLATTIVAADILADTRIERAAVHFVGNPVDVDFSWYFDNPSGTWYSPYMNLNQNNKVAITDHNGYYFLFSNGDDVVVLALAAAVSGQFFINTNAAGFQTSTIDGNGAPYSSINTAISKMFYHRSLLSNVSDNGRTQIVGTVHTSLGAPVSDANVVNTHSSFANTDAGGDFAIYAYVDTLLTMNGTLLTRSDRVILSSADRSCVLNFVIDEWDYRGGAHIPIIIDTNTGASPPYNNSADQLHYYNVGDFIATILSSAISTTGFKRGSDIQFGIVYYDEADRRTAVCTSDEINKHIAFYTEVDPVTSLIAPSGIPLLHWSVYNEPPEWATKWQWVRTKNTQLNYYLQWAIDDVVYQDDSGNTITPLLATKIIIRINNFAFYKQTHPNSSLNYVFTKGDRIRFIMNAGSIFYTQYYDYEILDVTTATATLKIDNDVNLPTLTRGVLYEIYTPRLQSNTNLFYEFSECYEVKTAIINGLIKKYHAGQTQDQTYGTLPLQIVTPATGTFTKGNAYYRQRNIPVGVQAGGGTSTQKVYAQIDDASISDFFVSEDESIGRVNTDLDDIGKVYRPTAFRVSDRYIQDTKINGLNAFQPLNQKQLSNDYGLINRLVLVSDGVLMAVCNNSKIVTMYINKNILKTAASGLNLLVALTDEVIAQSNILQRTFGSQNPESIAINDEQDVFMWDRNIGVIPRYTGNQLIPISDYKCIKYFSDASDGQMRFDPAKVKTPAVYDRYFDEYVITFNPIPAPSPVKPTTKICLPDLEPLVFATPPFLYSISIYCQPMNILLCNVILSFGAATYVTGIIIRNAINAGGSGFTATINPPSMCVIVTAPVAGNLFNNNSLVVTIKDFFHPDRNYSYPLEGGVEI